LILRAEFDPEPFILGPGAGDVVEALQGSMPFGPAIETGGPDFDLGALLGLLLSHNAITNLNN
jgi:hypothetical protein